ncbi:MAG: YtxH domain-containing protein [Pyrinomonadaceae bacterium]|nr:YtxH domain-containing protein [Sphingobacteriaceae bacterium]
MTNNSKLPTLLLAGLAAGAAAWYFLGTDEGKKTCNSLVDSLKGFSDSVIEKANETVSNVKDQMNNV